MGDFDTSQLDVDALAISGPTGTGGESFVYSGTTYYGVFNEVDRSILMDTTGFKDEQSLTLLFPRASLTANLPANAFVYRPFDSTTYQVIVPRGDLAWNEVVLRKPFAL